MITARLEAGAIRKLASKVSRWNTKLKAEVSRDLAIAAQNIRSDAVQGAPVDTGRLKGGTGIEKRAGGLNWKVFNNVRYAPYIEFGTGRRVNLSELKKAGFPASYAAQFKGKGIRQVNIRPQPFFFPAINRETPEAFKRIRKTMKKHAKKL